MLHKFINVYFFLLRYHRDEFKRILENGGIVQGQRVNGLLSVSRGLGDLMLKPAVGIEPTTQRWLVEPLDEFFVVACDGNFYLLIDWKSIDLKFCGPFFFLQSSFFFGGGGKPFKKINFSPKQTTNISKMTNFLLNQGSYFLRR